MSTQVFNSILTTPAITSGTVVSMDGTVVLVATPQGTKRFPTSVVVTAGDTVAISNGVVTGTIKGRETLPVFQV